MGMVKVRYLVAKKQKKHYLFYWSPNERYLVGGEWRDCPFVSRRIARETNLRADAINEAEKLNKQLDKWRGGIELKNISTEGSFDWLVVQYKKSEWFKRLGMRTKKEYGYILEDIRKQLEKRGLKEAPASEFTKQAARAFHHLFAATPRKGQLIVAISRIVFNYGIEMGQLTVNPFENLRIKKTKPREEIWLDFTNPNPYHLIQAFQGTAMKMGLDSVSHAMDIGLFTAQREGDILQYARNKYDGHMVKLRQGKTGVWVEMPALPALKQVLDNIPCVSPLFLVNERTGKSYNKDSFGDNVREVRREAGLPDNLKFMDLRRTAVVMLALAECTIPEISSITGHTNAEVSDILETYMPRNTEMAKNAMKKLGVYLARSWKESI